jgi:hypothetical protein
MDCEVQGLTQTSEVSFKGFVHACYSLIFSLVGNGSHGDRRLIWYQTRCDRCVTQFDRRQTRCDRRVTQFDHRHTGFDRHLTKYERDVSRCDQRVTRFDHYLTECDRRVTRCDRDHPNEVPPISKLVWTLHLRLQPNHRQREIELKS